ARRDASAPSKIQERVRGRSAYIQKLAVIERVLRIAGRELYSWRCLITRRSIQHPGKDSLSLFLLSGGFRNYGVGKPLQILTNGIFPHTCPGGCNQRCREQQIADPPAGAEDSVAVHGTSLRAEK